MFFHPDVVLDRYHQRHRELVAEADAHRLLGVALRRRRAARHKKAARGATSQVTPVARGRPSGSLAPCEGPGTAPAK